MANVATLVDVWRRYIAEGDTPEEQERRYRLCPESLKAGVGSHMRTVKAIRDAKRKPA